MPELASKTSFACTVVVSALGQKQTCALQEPMSALPPIATSIGFFRHVCFGPNADTRPVVSKFRFLAMQPVRRVCRSHYGARPKPMGLVKTASVPPSNALRVSESLAKMHGWNAEKTNLSGEMKRDVINYLHC